MSLIHKASLTIGRHINAYSELEKSKEEILVYMIERILNNFIFICCLLFFSYIFSIIKTTFIVTVVFAVLRSRFGGFHTKNDYVCLILSIVVSLAGGYAAAIIDIKALYIMIAYFVMLLTAMTIGVVDNEKKRLKDSKKKKFKLQGFIVLAAVFVLNILALKNGYVDISNAIMIGALLEFVNIPIGKIFA